MEMEMKMDQTEIIQGVKEYALANYQRSAWDVVVEAMDDEQIASRIGAAKTVRGAVRKMWKVVEDIAAYRSEIVNA